MKTAREWFAEYRTSHEDPRNKRIHFVAVPLIMLSLIGLLWQISLPLPVVGGAPWANAGMLLVVVGLCFYVTMRSARIFLVMLLATLVSLALVVGVQSLSWALLGRLALWGGVFVLCWIAQFIGHGVFEKKKPSFFEDLQFLLVGPAWVFAELLNMRFDTGAHDGGDD